MKIRPEEKKDWKAVENLTREAFWNKYKPGCDEHYILHRFRQLPQFVRELDCVLEEEGELVAHIMYSRAEIRTDGGRSVPVLIFGPVSVLPERQKKGYGGALIRHTLEKAARLGFGAVAVTGDPGYYHRFGFVSGSSMGIDYAGVPRGQAAPFFMVLELRQGYLAGVTGVFQEPDGYFAAEEDVEEFDRGFPPKEKKKLPGQLT